MRIATWNVNSLKARHEVVLAWLKEAAPDVVCFQELKMVDEAFPHEAFQELGYNTAVHGQKTYNGVAILSKRPIEEFTTGLPGEDEDVQARYIEAVISTDSVPLRIGCLYLPNGNPTPGEKYDYKLRWMKRLNAHAAELLKNEEPLILAGDYNIIPTADDVYNAKAWETDALFLPESRAQFFELGNLGFTDAIRACHAEAGLYTFWDYQAGAWPKNHGIRIDHLMLSPQAADRLVTVGIEKHTRDWERPSDHVPVWCELDI